MQDASFSVLRNLPPGHLMAYLDQLREGGSAAGEAEQLSMAQRDFFEQLGRTKRQMYKRWTVNSKHSLPCHLTRAVQYYLPPYRDCTKTFLLQQVRGDKGVSASTPFR